MNVVIASSGDKSGSQDTARIKAAVANGNDVELNGLYIINEPIATKNRITGAPRCVIVYVGPRTDQPVITLSGMFTCLSRAEVHCDYRARGVRWNTATGGLIADHVTIKRPRQLGVDFHDCWISEVNRIIVERCHGVGARIHRCNAAIYRSLIFSDAQLCWHADAAQNHAMWRYAAENGCERARVEFGPGYQEDWPAEHEVAAYERAVCVLQPQHSQMIMEGLIFEPCAAADYPALFCRSNTTRFDCVRFEQGYYGQSMVTVRGDGAAQGTHLAFQRLWLANKTSAKCILRLTGKTRGIDLRHVMIHGVHPSQSLVVAQGDGHSDLCVASVSHTTIPYVITESGNNDEHGN